MVQSNECACTSVMESESILMFRHSNEFCRKNSLERNLITLELLDCSIAWSLFRVSGGIKGEGGELLTEGL